MDCQGLNSEGLTRCHSVGSSRSLSRQPLGDVESRQSLGCDACDRIDVQSNLVATRVFQILCGNPASPLRSLACYVGDLKVGAIAATDLSDCWGGSYTRWSGIQYAWVMNCVSTQRT